MIVPIAILWGIQYAASTNLKLFRRQPTFSSAKCSERSANHDLVRARPENQRDESCKSVGNFEQSNQSVAHFFMTHASIPKRTIDFTERYSRC